MVLLNFESIRLKLRVLFLKINKVVDQIQSIDEAYAKICDQQNQQLKDPFHEVTHIALSRFIDSIDSDWFDCFDNLRQEITELIVPQKKQEFNKCLNLNLAEVERATSNLINKSFESGSTMTKASILKFQSIVAEGVVMLRSQFIDEKQDNNEELFPLKQGQPLMCVDTLFSNSIDDILNNRRQLQITNQQGKR